MDNFLIIKEDLIAKLQVANKKADLISKGDFPKLIIEPYIEDQLDELLLKKSIESDEVKLAFIDRQIDSISMFRRYLANIANEVSDLENQLRQINQELGN